MGFSAESQAGELERGDPVFYVPWGAFFRKQEVRDEFTLPQDGQASSDSK